MTVKWNDFSKSYLLVRFGAKLTVLISKNLDAECSPFYTILFLFLITNEPSLMTQQTHFLKNGIWKHGETSTLCWINFAYNQMQTNNMNTQILSCSFIQLILLSPYHLLETMLVTGDTIVNKLNMALRAEKFTILKRTIDNLYKSVW